MMLNPWFIVGALALWAASAWGAYGLGRDSELAAQAREDKALAKGAKVAADAAALAISRIRVNNTTIQGEVQREIVEKPVYRDCVHSPEQLQRLNAALAGVRPEPAGSGVLP